MKQYEILDISGDAGIRAFGGDLQELFINAACGMYSLITDLKDIQKKKTIEVSVYAASEEGLLVAFLNELIFHFDAYGFAGKGVVIKAMDAGSVTAVISGEDFNPARHRRKLLLKAATYHRLKVEKLGNHRQAEVIFDI